MSLAVLNPLNLMVSCQVYLYLTWPPSCYISRLPTASSLFSEMSHADGSILKALCQFRCSRQQFGAVLLTVELAACKPDINLACVIVTVFVFFPSHSHLMLLLSVLLLTVTTSAIWLGCCWSCDRKDCTPHAVNQGVVQLDFPLLGWAGKKKLLCKAASIWMLLLKLAQLVGLGVK